MIKFFNWFTKITAWLVQKICFRTKVYYENKAAQGRYIRGVAILISNHTSIYDYAVFLFVFFTRTLRYQMAEVLFRKPLLRKFLKLMGGIFVDRDSHDFSFMEKSQKILEKGGVVGVFPEGRIPEGDEEKPTEFKPGVTQLALSSGAPIIPVYTNGRYFKKERARVIIGEPIYVAELYDEKEDYKTNLDRITKELRNRIIKLGNSLEEKIEHERKKENE
jgi:1-acyl-sn-glycerol-3-phosphate acyltransferase